MTAEVRLPAPRTPGRYAVELVCLGNICRSPTAHVVLADAVDRAGLGDRVAVTSSGTAGWHTGKPMDARSAAVLRDAGLDPDRHRARRWEAATAASADLVLAMDAQNLADVRATLVEAGLVEEPGRVRLFRDLDPQGRGQDVPDPYYGGDDGFREVLAMVRRTGDELVAAIGRVLGA